MHFNSTPFNYELFFELSPDFLCIAGYDGYFKKVNPAMASLLEYSLEELYSLPINEFVHPEDQDLTSRVRDELTIDNPLFNFENRYVTKSGAIVWLSWTSHPVENDKLIFAIAKNISHKKSMDVGRNELLTNLTKINKELKHLTYMTSHDLRSPVSNLLSIFSLLDTSLIQDPETLELIGYFKMASEQLKETLDSYVDVLSEKHSTHSNIKSVSLPKSLKEVLKTIDALVKTSKANIYADFSIEDKIVFNKTYLNSIFLNLITNSIKYARPDKPPVISIYTQKGDGYTRVIFSDNGMGFDMKGAKDKIFSANQKFHKHSDSKGIGLYLVYNHVTSLGGKIDMESKPNEGTTFILSFRDSTAV